MPDRVVVLGSRRRNPPELMMALLALLSGGLFLVGANPPNALQQVMPSWLVVSWYTSLFAAGAVAILGNLWPGQLPTAMLIRLAGQYLTAGPCAAYAVAVFAFAGWRALFAGGVVAAWCLTSLWMTKHLTEDLRQIGRPR